MRQISILLGLATATLLLVLACSPSPSATLPRGSQATPSYIVVFTEAPAPESPREAQALPGGDVATLTFAVDEYSLPAYEDSADVFHAAYPTIRVVILDIGRVKGNWAQFAPTPAMMNELASSVDTFLLPESSLPVGLDSGALLDLMPLADGDPSLQVDDFFPVSWTIFGGRAGCGACPPACTRR